MYISKDNFNHSKDTAKTKEKKESQYILKVTYDSEDESVHKLLEGIFGEDRMLDVKRGKVAKITSTLTPSERDCFFDMVTESLNKVSNKTEQDDNSNFNNSNKATVSQQNNEFRNDEKDNFIDDKNNSVIEEQNSSVFEESSKVLDNNIELSQNSKIIPKESDVSEKIEIKRDFKEEKRNLDNVNSRKVSAEKLIKEFANFLNNI